MQEPKLAAQGCFILRAESGMHGRKPVFDRNMKRAVQQRSKAIHPAPGAHKESTPGDRCERHGDLQLRVVPASSPFPGMSPAVIEDVLSLAVTLHVERCNRDHFALVPDCKMARQPSRAGTDRATRLEQVQEPVSRERVDGTLAAPGPGAGTGIPVVGGNRRQACQRRDFQRGFAHESTLAFRD